MSSPAAATPTAVQGLLSALSANAKAGLTSALTQGLEDLTADAIGLAGEEAQDFDTFVDNLTEEVEAGKTWATAWADAEGQLMTTEKSQLMAEAMDGLKQISGIVDGFTKALEAFI